MVLEEEEKTHASSSNPTHSLPSQRIPPRVLHLGELEVVLGPRAWARAEGELRSREKGAVEDAGDDGDNGRRDAGATASTSVTSSLLLPSSPSAFCVLWCWSAAHRQWRWIHTSEAVQPCLLYRRRGRRRGGGGGMKERGDGGGGGGDDDNSGLLVCSWSPLDLGSSPRSAEEAREAAATARVIHLHVYVGERAAKSFAACRRCSSSSSGSSCPCGGDGGGKSGGGGETPRGPSPPTPPLLLSATLRLDDAEFLPDEGEIDRSYPSGSVLATLGAERVAWVPVPRKGGARRDEAKTTLPDPPLPPLPPPPPPAPLLAAASRAASARAKAVAAIAALDLALAEKKKQGTERSSELFSRAASAASASAAAFDGDARAGSLDGRARSLAEAARRSRAETARRAAALVEAEKGLKACLERIEVLRRSVFGGGGSGGSCGGGGGGREANETDPPSPSARAVLARVLSSLVARRCSLVAGIGDVMELTPKSSAVVAAASAAVSSGKGKEQQQRRKQQAGRGGEATEEDDDDEFDGEGDSTWDRLESGWSSGLGGIRQEQRAGNGNGNGNALHKPTTKICGLPLDFDVAGRGWQQRPNLPSKAQLDADAAALASAAAATQAIASVLGLPLRHPLRPVPLAGGSGGGGGGGSGGGAAVVFAPPPAGGGGGGPGKASPSSQALPSSSYSSSSSPAVVIDAVGAAMLFPGAAAAAAASSPSSNAEGTSAGPNGVEGGGAGGGGSSNNESSSSSSAASLLPSLLASTAEFPLFLPGSTVGGLTNSGGGGIGGGIGGIGALSSVPPSSSSASDDAAALLASTEPARFAYAVFLLNRDVQQLLDAHGLAGSGPGAAVDGLAKLVAAAASVSRS